VAAENDRLVNPVQLGGEIGFGRDAGEPALVVGRESMAAANRAEAGDGDRERERPFAHSGKAVRPEPLTHPGVPLVIVTEGEAIGVAAQEPDAVAQRCQPIERLGWKRAGDDVPKDDNPLGGCAAWIGEHRVERLDVAVNVGESGGRHCGDVSVRHSSPAACS